MTTLARKQRWSWLALVLAAVAWPAAQAQVGSDSEWSTSAGDIRIYVQGSSHYPARDWRAGSGPARHAGPSAFMEMQGSYRFLRWQGQYWVMGAPDSWRPNGGVCVPTRPNGYGTGDGARDYGEFDVTFNAAENAFTGQRRTVCRAADGRTRYGPWQPFTATRKGMMVATTPTARAPSATVTTGPGTGGGGSGASGASALGECASIDRTVLVVGGQQIRMNRRYGIRPCSIDAAVPDKFQIDFINPEGKRPTQVMLRAFRVTGPLSINRDTREILVPATFTGRIATQNLPFMGDPRPGSAWFNLLMPGSFCGSPFWLAHLRFSDGTQSDPFTVLTSPCGARLHPEELPAGASASPGVGPKPEIIQP